MDTVVLKKTARSVTERSVPFLTKIMGIMLILYGIVHFRITDFTQNFAGLMDFVGTILVVVCAVLILIDLSFSLTRAIGLYAIGVGGSRVLSSLDSLTNGEAVFAMANLVIAVTALNLCYKGYLFMKGMPEKRFSMIISSMIMIIIYSLMIVYIWRVFELPVEDMYEMFRNVGVRIFMLLVLIVMLSTEAVRNSTKSERYARLLNGIAHSNAYNRKAYIGRNVAKKLCRGFTDTSGWTPMDGHGPVQYELRFRMVNDVNDVTFVTVQRWKDSDLMYFTITDHKEGAILNAYRFSAVRIVPNGDIENCDSIFVFGSDGESLQLRVWNRKNSITDTRGAAEEEIL